MHVRRTGLVPRFPALRPDGSTCRTRRRDARIGLLGVFAMCVAAMVFQTGCTVGENIVIAPPDPPDISLPPRSGVDSVGRALTIMPVSVGGPVWSWTVEPPLPEGLGLDSVTGVISGAPREPWTTRTHRLIATGRGGADTATFTLRVVNRAPRIAYVTPVTDTALRAALHLPVMTGGTVDSFAIQPAPAAGYSFDHVTGELSGYPSDSAGAVTYRIIARGPLGADTAALTVSVVRPPGPFVASGADLSVALPATPGINVRRLSVTWTPVGAPGSPLTTTVGQADGFDTGSTARTFMKTYALAPLRTWAVEVRGLDASDSVVFLGRDTAVALRAGETRALAVTPAVRLAAYAARVFLPANSEGYGFEPVVALTFNRAVLLLGADTLVDTTAAGGSFAPDAFAVVTARQVPVARLSAGAELSLRVFGTAPEWSASQPLLSGAGTPWVQGTLLYSVPLAYHGPGSNIPPP